MPTFYANDIDIDPDEFIDACDSSDIKELIDCLRDMGYLSKKETEWKDERVSTTEEIFEEALRKLKGKWNMLSEEEESFILNISKRF